MVLERPHLRLDGLPLPVRLIAAACIACWGMVAVCVLSFGLSVDLPGGTFLIGKHDEIPKALLLVVYLALAATASALVLASFGPSWKLARATRIGIALLTVAFAVAPFGVASVIDDSERSLEPRYDPGPGRVAELQAARDELKVAIGRLEAEPSPSPAVLRLGHVRLGQVERLLHLIAASFWIAPSWLPAFLRVCGWAGLLAAVAVALSAALAPTSERKRLLVVAAAALPYLLGLAAYVVLLSASLTPQVPLGGFDATAIVGIVGSVALFVPLLLLWQAVAGADAARDLGHGAARTLDRLPYALAIFLLLKLAWLGCAYAGALPAFLGGGNGAIEASADDDLLAWLLALLAAGAAGAWLAKSCSLRVREDHLSRAAAIVVFALVAPLILAAGALMALASLHPFVASDTWTFQLLVDAGDWLAARQLAVQVAVVYSAGLAGALLWRRRGLDAPAGFLLLFCVLALPRAIGITAAWGAPDSTAGWYELATLDTAITLMVLALLAGPWRRSRRVTDSGLLVVVVASTTIAYAGTFVSSLWGNGAFYLALLLPMLYGLTLGARRLNSMGPDRATRLLAFAGAATGLLAISLVQLNIGLAGPGHFTGGELGRLFIVPPLAALFVAATCSALREREVARSAVRPALVASEVS